MRAVAAAVVVVAIVATGASAQRSVVAPPAGSDWDAKATAFRGQDGTRHTYVCPADGQARSVWGTDVYTDDSSVCTAAVHAGKITFADGGTVTIEIRAGLTAYTGSSRNGVTSQSYGSWSGSYAVVAAEAGGGTAGVKMGGAGWSTTATTHRAHSGVRYDYLCPSGGTPGRVWGTNVYTDDSSVCTAAVQVGLVTFAGGGNVTIEMRPGQSKYVSTTHNGVKSIEYGSWPGSFRFPTAATIPVAGPGGGGGGGGTTTTTGGGGSAPPATGTATGTVTVNGTAFTSGRIPYGALVDVTDGRLLLKADVGSITLFGAGVTAKFRLIRASEKKKALVEFRLTAGDFSVCPKRKKSSAAASSAATTVVRQLWGQGKGRFRTRGRYASATVRGTFWLTADRCDATLTRVRQGVVGVLDFRLRREIRITAGRTYLARP